MKHLIFKILIIAALFTACRRENIPAVTPPDHTGRVPLLLLAEGDSLDGCMETKSVDVTNGYNLNAFYASATTGTSGSEQEAWTSVVFTRSQDVFQGGKYWPIGNPGYHFYASNFPLTFHADGNTIRATTDTDAVCAYTSDASYKSANILSFRHVFARLGTLTVEEKDGYSISGVSITITPRTGGTYNLRTGYGRNNGTGWSDLATGTPVELTTGAPGARNNDLYLVPGVYTLTATWTATRGEYVETFTAKTQQVELTAGMISNLGTTLGGRAVDLEFKISVSEWGSATSSVTFPMS